MWIVFGVLSIVFAGITIVFAWKRNNAMVWTAICSMSCTALTTLAEYALVHKWVQNEDWSALMDVVPTMFGYLTGYVAVLVFLNVIALLRYQKRQSK